MNRDQLLHFFNEVEKLDPITGYAERNIEWFRANILPDLLTLNLKSPLLDAGCGYGYFTAHYADLFECVTGIDFSKNRIIGAKQHNARSNVQYETHDLAGESIALPQRFNTIISSAVLQHIDPELRSQVFRNLYDISAEGAIFVLYDEIESSESTTWDGFFGRISPHWVKRHVSNFWIAHDCVFIATGLQGESIYRTVLQRAEYSAISKDP